MNSLLKYENNSHYRSAQIYLSPASHLMSGATHDGWEDSTGSIISSESGFAHTGSVVNNQCGNFIIHG